MSFKLLATAVIISVATAVGIFIAKNSTAEKKESVLRVSYPYFQGIESIDTAKILTLYQYNIAHNLFSRLVEYNMNFQLVSGIAESFSINGDEVEFTFGKKVATIDGHQVTAEDAAYSLKRLIMLGRSGHGDIRRLLCPNKKLSSISDDCPGISVKENKLILRPIRPHFLQFLISALESADYGIIPRSSLSADGLKIVDYRNTSGPYYVSVDSPDGKYELKANPKHFHYNQRMPQTIRLIPTKISGGAEMLKSGQADLVTTSESYSGSLAASILNDKVNYSVFASQPFRVDMICFSSNAIRNFTPSERIQAALAFVKAKNKLFPPIGHVTTTQFFQALSDGTLSTSQLKEIEDLRSLKASPKRPISLGSYKTYAHVFEKELEDNKDIKVQALEKFAFEYSMKDRPDMYFIATDSAWTENISLLGHNFEADVFHGPNLDPNLWFEDYLETFSKEGRIKKLNSLHFDLLKNASIVPVAAYPYFAVATKEWSLNFSTLGSTTDLWRIRRN